MKSLKEKIKYSLCREILNFAVSKNWTAKTLVREAQITEEEASKILRYDYESLTVDFIALQYDNLIYNKKTTVRG